MTSICLLFQENKLSQGLASSHIINIGNEYDDRVYPEKNGKVRTNKRRKHSHINLTNQIKLLINSISEGDVLLDFFTPRQIH